MRWFWRVLKEYAFVIGMMLVAGMIIGGCAVLETNPPRTDPLIPISQCQNAQPIRLMPNYIHSWDPPHMDHWT